MFIVTAGFAKQLKIKRRCDGMIVWLAFIDVSANTHYNIVCVEILLRTDL